MYVSSSVIAGMFVALAFASEFLGERRRKLRLPIANRLERSGGVLNRTQYPSDVIALVVLWRLRYKLSLRDLTEMFQIRGT